MLNESLEMVRKIEAKGYETYIIGGFVRDYYMKKHSYDVDICTSAKPKDLLEIFPNAILPKEKYGAVTLYYKNIRYEITTFRRELAYLNRRPIDLEYSSSFFEDIQRRDFRMNTLCMNSKGEIMDMLNGRDDIDKKIIKIVGNAKDKFKEDPLRILRAIRFATQLNFKLDNEILNAINDNGNLLRTLSYERKKSELNKIFVNINAKYGIKLLITLGLSEYLDLNNLSKLKMTSDVLGIWAQLNVLDKYPFSRIEKDTINTINILLKNKKIGKYEIYQYGLYNVSIAAEILGINRKLIVKLEKGLPIRSNKDIDITNIEICEILNKEPGKWLKEVFKDIEYNIIYSKLENNKDKIKEYILKKY